MLSHDRNSGLTEITPEIPPHIPEDAGPERRNRTRPFFIGAVAVCLLVSVALYNGYPTIFSDTGSYILTGALLVALTPFRAPGYAMFTRFTSLGTSAWFIILAQALIVAYVLYEICDYLNDRDPEFRDLCFVSGVCVLTVLTSLPWVVSLVMPDVFAGVVFLSAFLLAFAQDLPLVRRILLAAIFMISVSAHSSFLPTAIAFVTAMLVLKFAGRGLRIAPRTKSVVAWLLVPIIVAGLWTARLNRDMGLGFRLAPSRNLFLLGRLFGNGLAADFLRERCPTTPFISCRYLSNLPQTPEQFLFWHPLIHDLYGHEDEMETIIRGTIRSYPIRFAMVSARDTLLQLATLRTGDEIRTYGAAQWNNKAIQQVFPGDFQAMSNDKQFRGRLLALADALAPLQTTIFWLSMVACLLFARSDRFERMNMFLYSVIIFLVINAAVCATFAGVYDRYQSRVAWLIPLSLTAYCCCLAKAWKRGVVPERAPLYDLDTTPADNPET